MMYDVLFVGATALAVGGCEEASERGYLAAVMDARCTVGNEFSQACRHEVNDAPPTARGLSLIAEMRQRNVMIQKDRVSFPALGPILAGRLKASGAQPFFLSEIMSIACEDDGYLVEFVCFGKRYAIRTRVIIDTSADFCCRLFLDGEQSPQTTSSLSVAITQRETAPVYPEFYGRFDQEIYLRYPVNQQESLSSAWVRVLEERRQNPRAFGDARVIEPAVMLDCVPLEQSRYADRRLQWRPSAACANAVCAFDLGAKLICRELFALPLLPTAAPSIQTEPSCDVLVAGLGTAGSISLMVAAEHGLNAVGLESFGCLGGSATLGTVTGYYHGVKGGAYRQIDQMTNALCEETSVQHAYAHTRAAVLQRELNRVGANVHTDAMVCGVLRQGMCVQGLIWKDSCGFHSVNAKYVIDATGNADVATMAGCALLNGRESDDTYMAFSVCCREYDAVKGCYRYAYRDNGLIDPRDAAAFGRTLIEALSQDNQLPDLFTAEPRFLGTAAFVGVREGARILGEETVRLGDFLNGEISPQPSFWCLTNIDQHNKDHAFESRTVRAWLSVTGMWGYNLGIPVPANALIPKDWRGILCAGRCISMDHDAALGLRMRDDCSKSGEVAAVLAALSLKQGRPAKEVNYDSLKQALTQSGCLKAEDGPIVARQQDGTGVSGKPRISWWLGHEDEIRLALSSDRPGIGIWSASLLGSEIAPQLVRWMSSSDERLRANAALALGLMGDEAANHTLMEIAADRSGYIPDTSWMYVPARAVAAICALGLCACEEAIPLLLKIVQDPDYARDIPLRPSRFLRDKQDQRFQYFTHAFVALVEIGKAYPRHAAAISESLHRILNQPGFVMCSTMMDTDRFRPDMTGTLTRILRTLDAHGCPHEVAREITIA